MADFEIVATPRSELGKAAIRRMRRTGQVPGIVYGAGKDPQPVSLTENVLRKQMENEAFFAHVLTAKIDGQGEEQVVVKALQRHPATSRVLHLDLLRVSATQKISMQVPLHFENEDTAVGVKQGGTIAHLLTEVTISCLPSDLPEFISVDVGNVDVGESIHLSDLVLPAGAEISGLDEDHDSAVLNIAKPRGFEEDEGEAAEGEADAAEGGEE